VNTIRIAPGQVAATAARIAQIAPGGAILIPGDLPKLEIVDADGVHVGYLEVLSEIHMRWADSPGS
jgi:hypothetical protein